MNRMGKKTAAYISVVAVFAFLTSFSMAGADSLSTALSALQGTDRISPFVYVFPDQIVKPAMFNKMEDSSSSIIRTANQRFFDLHGPIASGSASCFSRLLTRSTERSFDSKSVILVKLRI